MNPSAPGLDIHIYPNTLEFQSRIERITSHIQSTGLFSGVEAVGIGDGRLPPVETKPDGRVIRRFPIQSGLRRLGVFGRALDFGLWYGKIFSHYWRKKVDVVNAHSMSILPLALAFKVFKRSVLVYQPHELETGTTFSHAPKWLAALIERTFIKGADEVATVTASISEEYRKAYKLDHVWTVRTLPPRRSGTGALPADYYAKLYNFGPDEIVYLYRGILTRGRGISRLIEAFAQVPRDKHLVFLGYGEEADAIKEAASRYRNIHYHEPRSGDALLDCTAVSDAGVMLPDVVSVSHIHAYPSKYTDSLTVGVPLVASDFMLLCDEIRRYNAGWAIAPEIPDIVKLITALDRNAIDLAKAGARKWSEENTWESEAAVLDAIYQSAAKRNAQGTPT